MRIDKNLLLDPELVKLVQEGKKTVTVRFGKRGIDNPNYFEIIDNTNEMVKISAKVVNIKYTKIKDMTNHGR